MHRPGQRENLQPQTRRAVGLAEADNTDDEAYEKSSAKTRRTTFPLA